MRSRILTGLLATLAVLLGWGAVAAPATRAAERAVISWDTDATDVDLHVWDEDGNHAWFADQSGIPAADLSTDIRFGYGPESFEEFQGAEGYSYTYGICYFASNREDGVVPPTVVTITLIDPDGTQRTVKRVLRQAKEAYYLGDSPTGAGVPQPDADWCGGTSGNYHQATDAGEDPGTVTGQGCTRTRRVIGAVTLCADDVAPITGGYRATGNVTADGGVLLGNGPFLLNTDKKTITGQNAYVRVARGTQLLPIGAGDVAIDATGAPDPLTGRPDVAKLDIGAIRPELNALKAAGLPLTLDGIANGHLALAIDPADGGGVIVQTKLSLPFAGKSTDTALAIGVHSASTAAVRVLGGSATFGDVALPGGWGLTGLSLSYQQATDTWTAAGGLKTPMFGLDVTGSIADGKLDALGVGFTKDIPLGNSGFILSRLTGGVSGLATPPLKISAGVSGRWGSVPGLPAGVLLFKDVTLTLDLSGNVSLRGKVSMIRDPSPVNGNLALALTWAPAFKATGSLDVSADAGPLELAGRGGIALSTAHFTAVQSGTAKVFGKGIGSVRGIVSDRGMGITGKACFITCATLGAGMRWDEFPRPRWIGGDVDQFSTISARGDRVLHVQDGRPFLITDAIGPAGTTPEFTLRDPSGRRYSSTGQSTERVRIVHDPEVGYTGVLIAQPRPGRWTVRPAAQGGAVRLYGQAIHKVTRVHVTRLTPRGSSRHPIARTAKRKVTLRWDSRGLPSGARVSIYVGPGTGDVGRLLAGGRRTRGTLRIATSKLDAGVNRFRLVVTQGGVAVDSVLAPRAVVAK